MLFNTISPAMGGGRLGFEDGGRGMKEGNEGEGNGKGYGGIGEGWNWKRPWGGNGREHGGMEGKTEREGGRDKKNKIKCHLELPG